MILAVRTTINALGAYITTEELCKRYLPNTSPADVKRNIIIASTSALVAGILGGNGILNTLEHAPVSSLQEPLSELVPQKVTSEHVQAQVLSAPYDTNPSSLLSES